MVRVTAKELRFHLLSLGNQLRNRKSVVEFRFVALSAHRDFTPAILLCKPHLYYSSPFYFPTMPQLSRHQHRNSRETRQPEQCRRPQAGRFMPTWPKSLAVPVMIKSMCTDRTFLFARWVDRNRSYAIAQMQPHLLAMERTPL